MNHDNVFGLIAEPTGLIPLFLNFTMVVVCVYVIILVINFFRDKFINPEPTSHREDISGLLLILFKLFQYGAYGIFVISFFSLLFGIEHQNFKPARECFVYAILIFFLGLAFRAAWKALNPKSKD